MIVRWHGLVLRMSMRHWLRVQKRTAQRIEQLRRKVEQGQGGHSA